MTLFKCKVTNIVTISCEPNGRHNMIVLFSLMRVLNQTTKSSHRANWWSIWMQQFSNPLGRVGMTGMLYNLQPITGLPWIWSIHDAWRSGLPIWISTLSLMQISLEHWARISKATNVFRNVQVQTLYCTKRYRIHVLISMHDMKEWMWVRGLEHELPFCCLIFIPWRDSISHLTIFFFWFSEVRFWIRGIYFCWFLSWWI